MKVYIAIKHHSDNRNKELIETISERLFQQGIESCCLSRDIEDWGNIILSPEELMKFAFEHILQSDFIVMEMSEKGVGLGIEAGYAYANNKPIIVLINDKCKLSKTMKGIAKEVISYDVIHDVIFSDIINKREY